MTNYFNSSVLQQATYDENTRVMLLTFRGNRMYAYQDMHQDAWQAFIQSESAGAYYNNHIRGQLACTRLI